MTQYINKDIYVEDTGKQLKDIKTNADNIDKIKDYVSELIEYGTQELDDKWYYRSFGSGFGELFRRIIINNVTINKKETESDYYCEYNIELPYYFGRIPIVNVTVELSGGYSCHYVIGNVTTRQITGWIYTDIPRTDITVILHVYCVGR